MAWCMRDNDKAEEFCALADPVPLPALAGTEEVCFGRKLRRCCVPPSLKNATVDCSVSAWLDNSSAVEDIQIPIFQLFIAFL